LTARMVHDTTVVVVVVMLYVIVVCLDGLHCSDVECHGRGSKKGKTGARV